MQHDELRKKAKQKVEEKKAFYIVAFIFAAISLILLVISWQFGGTAAFWIRFPILVLALVLGVIYVAIFGMPFTRFMSAEWEEEQVRREMTKIYHKDVPALPAPDDLTEEEKLELEELDRLKQKWDYRSEDFV